MKNKFWFLTKMSLKKKIKSKTFIIVNILLAIVVISLANIDKIVTFFGGDFNKTNNIMVLDNTGYTYDKFKDTMNNEKSLIDTGLKYKIKNVTDENNAKKEIKKEEDILIILNENDDNVLDVKLVTYGYINANMYQLIQNSINSTKQYLAIKELNISDEDLDKISKNVSIEREYIDKNKSKEEENMNLIMGVVTPIIILPFFFLIMLVIQMIGAEINEEKSTKSMEIIISNVSANVHFFSKVLAANLFVILQSLAVALYGFIGIMVRGGNNNISKITEISEVNDIVNTVNESQIFSNIGSYIPLVLILMFITLIGYSLLAGILASMTTNMEDFQQLQTPIIVISLIGFYLSLMSSMFDGSLFIRIISYIPFISAILSPSLLITGVIGLKDILLSILLMVVVIYFLIKYGLKIYKEGILNYSGSNLWKKMLKAMKE